MAKFILEIPDESVAKIIEAYAGSGTHFRPIDAPELSPEEKQDFMCMKIIEHVKETLAMSEKKKIDKVAKESIDLKSQDVFNLSISLNKE